MKVALCLSGDPRDFDYIWIDFINKLKFSDHEIDFYIHNWFRGSVGVLDGGREDPEVGIRSQVSSMAYLQAVRPVRAVVERYECSHVFRNFGKSEDPLRSRSYSMFYGIQNSFQLVQQPDRYDLIVRSRPDIFFERSVDFTAMRDVLNQLANSAIFLDLFINPGAQPSHPDAGWGAWTPDGSFIEDFFWVFRPNLLMHFCKIYDQMTSLCADFEVSNIHSDIPGKWIYLQEFFLMKWLRYSGISPVKFSDKMLLSRHHKAIFDGVPFV
jgi:hypothetical protein